jgi:hypothetical protein
VIKDQNVEELRNLVLGFIIPVVKSIRHGENYLAERWYWSWWKGPNTNLFCRLYFLAKNDKHDKIWKIINDLRKQNFNDIISSGNAEQVMTNLTNDELEIGIVLEHASEMSLMVWKGFFPGTEDRYGKAFHRFFQPLLISEKTAIEILQQNIGNY